jgi:hypothetical protein
LLLTLGLFPLKIKKYLHHPPVTGIHIFYEGCSTETFRKEELTEELFLLTASLNFCGGKEVIEDHGF